MSFTIKVSKTLLLNFNQDQTLASLSCAKELQFKYHFLNDEFDPVLSKNT